MPPLTTCLLLLGLPAVLLLSGYPLVARLALDEAAERLALALLAGLALLLWNVSVLGALVPIAGAWAWLALWPVALALADRRARQACAADLATAAGSPKGRLLAATAGLVLVALLWPQLSRPGLVFHDGTSNHDAFFWISGADYLRTHSYLAAPVLDPWHPYTAPASIFAGTWFPVQGRMAAEGLLALAAALVRTEPIRVYLPLTAALLLPWIAATFLVARTFLTARLGWPSVLALGSLQPLFVFFQANGNLPNLLGVLAGALAVVAFARTAANPAAAWGWRLLLALALHGLLCAYPEVLPPILLTLGLLWLRAFARGTGPSRAALLRDALAVPFLVFLLNPVTSIRGVAGMLHSLLFAQTRDSWPNIFSALPDPTYPLALATMNRQVANDLGPVLSVGAGLFVLLAAGYGLARARDRFGAAALFVGPGLLLLYTLATGFAYGWQKTVQFSGVFLPALLPVAVLAAWPGTGETARRRAGLIAAGSALLLLFGHATARNHYEAFKWSGRKLVTEEWFALRHWAAGHPADAPVLVVGPSFRFPYFHGMWAAYALEPARVAYAAGDPQPGGYLAPFIQTEVDTRDHPPRAWLVSGEWARSLDANSRRLLDGETVVLLAETNRVTALTGATPAAGVPQALAGQWTMDLVPHHAAELVVTLAAPDAAGGPGRWRLERRLADDAAPLHLEVSGPPPWQLVVPLQAGVVNRIRATADDADPARAFDVVSLTIRSPGAPVTQ